MAIDINKWLKDEMQFSDAEVAEIAPKFAAKAQIVERGYLAQADYSRMSNELQAAKTAHTAASDRLNAELAEFAELQASGNVDLSASRQRIDKLEADMLKRDQAVRRLATAAGEDPDAVLTALGTAPNPNPNPSPAPGIDTTKFVTVEAYNALATAAISLPAELMAIGDEHFALTGVRLDPRTVVTELNARAGAPRNQKSLNPRVIWEELNGIPAKRAAKATADHDAEIAAAVERGKQEALTNLQVPTGGSPAARHAPVLVNRPASVLQRPQPGSAVASAVNAFNSGKYRPQAART